MKNRLCFGFLFLMGCPMFAGGLPLVENDVVMTTDVSPADAVVEDVSEIKIPVDAQALVDAVSLEAATDAGAVDVGIETGLGPDCVIGETRPCYSGPPETEGVGRCHGATRYCVADDAGVGRWSPDCVGKLTPYPWGDLPHNGIDDDCDHLIDEDDQHLNGTSDEICDPEGQRGCFWFCEPFDPAGTDVYGYQGCCTSGRFRSLREAGGELRRGMWIKGSAAPVHVFAGDLRKHAFPTTTVLASWASSTASGVNIRRHPEACLEVIELPDELFAAIPPARNATYHPGVVTTGSPEDPTVRYVVSRGGMLRRLAHPELGLPHLGGPTTLYTSLEGLYAEFLFLRDYRLGAPVERPSDYNDLEEWPTTIDHELMIEP